MLVNAGTRSGKEVLAYGFKKHKLGEVIGTRTEGAVLAATAFLVGRGLLLLAVEDVLVDGERLEVALRQRSRCRPGRRPQMKAILSLHGLSRFFPTFDPKGAAPPPPSISHLLSESASQSVTLSLNGKSPRCSCAAIVVRLLTVG
jgi:hypothetical protein